MLELKIILCGEQKNTVAQHLQAIAESGSSQELVEQIIKRRGAVNAFFSSVDTVQLEGELPVDRACVVVYCLDPTAIDFNAIHHCFECYPDVPHRIVACSMVANTLDFSTVGHGLLEEESEQLSKAYGCEVREIKSTDDLVSAFNFTSLREAQLRTRLCIKKDLLKDASFKKALAPFCEIHEEEEAASWLYLNMRAVALASLMDSSTLEPIQFHEIYLVYCAEKGSSLAPLYHAFANDFLNGCIEGYSGSLKAIWNKFERALNEALFTEEKKGFIRMRTLLFLNDLKQYGSSIENVAGIFNAFYREVEDSTAIHWRKPAEFVWAIMKALATTLLFLGVGVVLGSMGGPIGLGFGIAVAMIFSSLADIFVFNTLKKEMAQSFEPYFFSFPSPYNHSLKALRTGVLELACSAISSDQPENESIDNEERAPRIVISS